ncbi:MAG: hypothetical protein HY676_02475 [Chloroflexi bacterium]|nr:hypothetical protein [Chloroflexota bacterium]
MRLLRALSLALISGILALIPLAPALGQEPTAQVTLWTEVPGVIIASGEEYYFPVHVTNNGPTGLFLNMSVSPAPSEWGVSLVDKDSGTPRGVQRVYVNPKVNPEDVGFTIFLHVWSSGDAPTGDYEFVVTAQDLGTGKEYTLTLKATLKEATSANAGRSARIETTYPQLSAPSGQIFEYSLLLINDSSDNLTFDLQAQTPPLWDVVFRDSYERQKQFSSIGVKAKGTEFITVSLTPPTSVEVGSYNVRVTIRAGEVTASQDLVATVTGMFEMKLSTPSGRLNADATVGRESSFPILVTNTGTMPIQNVGLSANYPQNWKVTFDPARMNILQPYESREVSVTLIPARGAIAGDYAITLFGSSTQSSHNIDIRVSLGAPTIWGWVGLGIVLAVIAGLAGLFVKVGRR